MKKVLVTTVILWFCATSFSYGGELPPFGGEPGCAVGRPGALLEVLYWLDLSDAQKKQVSELFKAKLADFPDPAGEEAQARREEGRALQDATARGDVDAVTTLARSMSARLEKRLQEGARFMAAFRAILTDTQRNQLDSVREKIQARMEQARKRHEEALADGAEMAPPRKAGRPVGRLGFCGPREPIAMPGAGLPPMEPGMGFPPYLPGLMRDMQAWVEETGY